MSNYFGAPGASNEWYTPKYIFDALGCTFDMDVANAAIGGTHVPCKRSIGSDSLDAEWTGFIWMNAPFGGRNGLVPWLDKFFEHGDGIALVPDRTSAPWFQDALGRSDTALFIAGKVKFERPDGSIGKSPGDGTVLLAVGFYAERALWDAECAGLGVLVNVRKSA